MSKHRESGVKIWADHLLGKIGPIPAQIENGEGMGNVRRVLAEQLEESIKMQTGKVMVAH